MRGQEYRAWDGERMVYDVVPFQWDFCISRGHWVCLDHDRIDGHPNFKVEGIPFKELMQDTGLEDKNGKKIYEGDIIKHGEGEDPVHWKDGEYMLGSWTPFGLKDHTDIEVIGNIYENPDLLGGKEGVK